MDTRIPENAATGETLPTEEQMERMHRTLDRAREYATEQAQAADRLLRQYPYHSMGVALGVGVLIGMLISRK